MGLPGFEELKKEKEYILNVEEDILKNLCEEDEKEMNKIFSSKHREDWRNNKEIRILSLLKNGKTLEDLHLKNPITLGLDENNELTICDGFTRINVARKLRIKKIKVILAQA